MGSFIDVITLCGIIRLTIWQIKWTGPLMIVTLDFVLLAARHLCMIMPCHGNASALLALGDVNTLRPRRNEQHFADDIFKRIVFNENVWISIKISLKFVPKGPINNIPALGQIMAWRRSGDKPLSEPMMVSLPTHICVTRPQWVNPSANNVLDWTRLF